MKFWRTLCMVLLVIVVIMGVAFYFMTKHYKGEADANWDKYQTQVLVAQDLKNKWDEERSRLLEIIAQAQGEIDSAYTQISDAEEAIAGKEVDIQELKRLRPLLSDKDQIINNLDQQVNAYEVKFSLAMKEIENYKGVVFSLTSQSQAKDRMIQIAESQTLAESTLRQAAESGWQGSQRTVSILRKTGRLTRAAFVGSVSVAFSSQLHGASLGSSLLVGAVVSTVTYFIWH